MEADYVSIGAAFLAGVVSFVSPCLLPLIPIYIGYLGGSTVGGAQESSRLETLVHAVLFVIGFSLIFIVLGASFGLLGSALQEHMPLLRKVGGALLVILGLQLAGVITIPLLSREQRFDLGGQPKVSHVTSFVMGLVFGFAWTPCIGPILAAILTLAAATETATQGAVLLTVYSAGLAVPFLVTALAMGIIGRQLRKLNQHMRLVSIISGLLVIALGILLLTDQFQALVSFVGALTLS